MIDMTTSLRHLIWGDALLFDRLTLLPPEALSAKLSANNKSVIKLAVHIVGDAEWYQYCLTGHPY